MFAGEAQGEGLPPVLFRIARESIASVDVFPPATNYLVIFTVVVVIPFSAG